ncbi:hypothetical protein QBZ16_002121 [Prototheca wickerhamii]|uniref:ACT domain-containing protein n=1 Tax=Prototheca wickerhamii TaxID=3111 RepID=A0AAD9MNW3_PROWI|nr:hypothetical protein QBZ16_002121 [Prototheca wickerhamii]
MLHDRVEDEYAVAVFDPASGTLRTVPVRSNSVLRLQQQVHGVDYEPTRAGAEEQAAPEDMRAAAMRLVEQLGSQRRKRQLRAREASRVDPTQTVSSAAALRAVVATGGAAEQTLDELMAQAVAARPLPPHDPEATTAERAYPVRRGLVWDGVWDALAADELLAAAEAGPAAVAELKSGGLVRTDYVASRLADADWRNKAGGAERARLLALGRDSLEAKVGISGHVLVPVLRKFYTHHPASMEGSERWALAPAGKELMFNWAVASALRAEVGSTLDSGALAALAAGLQCKPGDLLQRCRELGAAVVSVSGRGTQVALLPPSARQRTLASYFPEIKTKGKRVAITGNKAANGAEQLKEEARAAQEKELPAVIEVKIDNHTEPFATIVTVEYGDKLGELLDTVAALKALGLNIKRAKLGADDKHKFYITDAETSEKIVKSSRLEEIRLTILNNLLRYHPEASAQLAWGSPAAYASDRSGMAGDASPLGVRKYGIKTQVEVRDDESGLSSKLLVNTVDRPGLLTDIVHILKDISLNVISAEVDTIGRNAFDVFQITYHGEPLPPPMCQLVVNSLQYYLSANEMDKEWAESY